MLCVSERKCVGEIERERDRERKRKRIFERMWSTKREVVGV